MSHFEMRQLAPFRGLGLGESASETPEIRELPWEIGKEHVPSKQEIKEARWEKASMVIGVLGGLFGLVLSYRALTSRE